MNNSYAVGFVTVAVLLGAVGIAGVVVNSRPVEPVCDVSVKVLLADPEFHAGRRVRLSASSFERGADATTLRYRTHTDRPPAVVCTFTHPVPDPVPDRFVGEVRVAPDGTVTVVNCVPAAVSK